MARPSTDRILTIRGYGEVGLATALDVAKLIDVHDRPAQSRAMRANLAPMISAALGIPTNEALNTARTTARVLDRLGIRERPDYIRAGPPRMRPGDMPDRRRKPRASAA